MSNVPTTSPDIGLVLNDRYRVEEMIARGGMATVYRGLDERLQRSVALKIMHPHLADNPEFLSRFRREARSIARLSHPHVVSLYDQGEDQGRIYLAMQLVDGDTLRDELRRERTLPLKRALRVGRDVLAALDAAHRSGIIHRDIKPENVLVNHEHDILVTDFGLARAVGSATASATGTLLGTVAYVSPEVVTRGSSDARSDLYSWGIMMFEMLTGRTPFQGDSPVHIAYQHVHDDIPAPSQYFPGLPPSIDALVTWAAARRPASRPARAHEILLALDEALATLTEEQLNARAPLSPSNSAENAYDPTATRDIASFPTHGTDLEQSDEAAGRSAASSSVLAAFLTKTKRAAGGNSSSDRGEQTRAFDGSSQADSDESVRELTLRSRRRPAGWRAVSSRRSPAFGIATIAIVLLAIGALGFAGQQWYVNEGPGADRTVPLLAGASLSDAESALKADGLTLSTQDAYSDSVPKGHIIKASPSPGTEVKRGDAVTVVVSLGKPQIAIPETAGKDAREVKSTLTGLGFVVTETTEHSETVPKGKVIRHEAAAASLPKGSPITVVISDGPKPIAIPQVTGHSRAAATKALQDAGFTVKVTQAHSSNVPKGSIASQNPASGTGFRGNQITIVESLGPDLVKVPDVFQKPEAEAKATLEKAGFKVNVQYDRGKPVLGLAYQQSVAAGQQAERGSTITINVF